MRLLRNTDANQETGGTSSTSSTATTAEQVVNTDATADSSTASQTDDKEKPTTVQDVIDKVKEKHESTSEVTEEAPTAEVEKEEGEDQEAEVNKNTEAEIEVDQPGDEKLPFHKDKRFQEVIKQKNEYKQKYEQAEPQLERVRQLDTYCAQNKIDPQQFAQVMQIAALMNADPKAALEALRPHYEMLEKWNGNKLDQDLDAEVVAGALSPERAKEIQFARLQKGQTEYYSKQQQAQSGQQKQQEITGAWNQWDTSRRQQDPDFKPKVDQNAPDGKWEFVNFKLQTLAAANPPKTSADALALVEKAYNDVSKSFGHMLPKKPLVKSLSSTSSSKTASPVVKSAKDVIAAIRAGKKPSDLKYA